MKYRLVVFLLAIAAMGNAIGDESSYSPARFDNRKHSLEDLIKFPEVEGDVYVAVYCLAVVEQNGQNPFNSCLRSDSVDWAFPTEVEYAVRSSSFTPATVDGKTYFVELYYRVTFVRKNGQSEIGVYPNWGDDTDKYGMAYEAPQRLIEGPSYPIQCSYELKGLGQGISTTVVGEDGTLTGTISFAPDHSSSHRHRVCLKEIKRRIERSRFIPALAGGEPVEAKHVEVWGTSRDFRLE